MALTRLALTDFRSYPDALVAPGPGLVVLTGENGAGKTNVLEAVSLLSPGRGLRGAVLPEMARRDGAGSFAVAARLGDVEIGTGTTAAAPERRQVRINGAPASATSLSEWLSILWLTPAMDRLFQEGASGRRRFLDRLVLALSPGHAVHAARYEAAMRARNKLLTEERPDADWLTALEARMAEHGAALSEARRAAVAALTSRLARAPEGPFARAGLALEAGGRISLSCCRRPAAATLPPGGRLQGLTAPILPSPISARPSPPPSVLPVSRRRCCSASFWLTRTSSPSAPAGGRSCSSTRWRRTSTLAAAPPCSSACRHRADRCG